MTESRQRGHKQTKPLTEERAEKLTAGEAKKYLGCSPVKLTRLLASGQLAYERDPLDGRAKLIKRADLEAFLRQRGRG
jgi:excisionase family DNA binding protein